jgi:hypothetical protein
MVTFNPPRQLSSTSWRISWTSDATPAVTFYVYRDGVLIATTTATQWDLTVPPGTSPVIEVLDTADPPEKAYPGRIVLTWYSVAGTSSYKVQEYITTIWVDRDQVTDDGRGYFVWTSRWLEDSTTHQFRIVPAGTNGNDGTPQELDVLMVRHPDDPTPTLTNSYSDTTHAVTIDVA